jgi:hypothetical protein
VDHLRREGIDEHLVQVGAVEGVIRRTEALLDRLSRRLLDDHAVVVPAPHDEGVRSHPDAVELRTEPEPMQQPRRVRADLHAGPDLPQRGSLLVDVDRDPVPAQTQGGGQPTDSGADDDDLPLGHPALCPENGCQLS